MLQGFDHLVLMVQDLDEGSRDFEKMGFTVIPGGRHGSGTHNALIALDDGSYIELIAFHETNEAHRWWKWKVAGGGLIDYCMRSSSLDEDLSVFAQAGVVYGAPYRLTRRRPDAFELDWEIAVPQEPRLSGAPFLIRDKTSREERAPRYVGHQNGIRRICRMVHVVNDIELVRAWASRLAGAKVEPVSRPGLEAGGLRVTVAAAEVSSSTVDFLVPDSGASPLAAVLASRGAVPYSLEFAGTDLALKFEVEQAHGARLLMTKSTN